MLNEHEIGVVVGQVAEDDEAGEQGDGRDQRHLGRTNGDHGYLQGRNNVGISHQNRLVRDAPYFANSAIASSASTPPVIAIGAKRAFSATSALDSMI